jgi:hypothetical protein
MIDGDATPLYLDTKEMSAMASSAVSQGIVIEKGDCLGAGDHMDDIGTVGTVDTVGGVVGEDTASRLAYGESTIGAHGRSAVAVSKRTRIFNVSNDAFDSRLRMSFTVTEGTGVSPSWVLKATSCIAQRRNGVYVLSNPSMMSEHGVPLPALGSRVRACRYAPSASGGWAHTHPMKSTLESDTATSDANPRSRK